eukprot:gb/GECG01005849.1/.p1 GENE.gb/GECG01005849.1/~~gb/GECG01005849.1/.p1  ORF type:complete len:269 (+),score=50.37 gb/GECG01005849.1/:1-807(+)
MEAGDTISQLDDFEKRMKELQKCESINKDQGFLDELPDAYDMSSSRSSSETSIEELADGSHLSQGSSRRVDSPGVPEGFNTMEDDEDEEEPFDASAREEEKQVEIDTLQQRIEELQAQLQENEKKLLEGPSESTETPSFGWPSTLSSPLETHHSKSHVVGFADEPRRAQTAATSGLRSEGPAKNRLNCTDKERGINASPERPRTRQNTKTFTSNDVIIAKIKANLKTLEPGRRPVVLVSTGAYNPIHLQHLRMFYQARDVSDPVTNIC